MLILIFVKLQWDEEHISYNFDVRKGPIHVEYFKGGLTNICYNALDRHVAAGHGDRVCFLWEGNDLDQDRKMTYGEVLEEVCQLVSGGAAGLLEVTGTVIKCAGLGGAAAYGMGVLFDFGTGCNWVQVCCRHLSAILVL